MDWKTYSHISLYFIKPCPAIDLPSNVDPHYLVASFIAALESPASHSKVQMETLFTDIEKGKKIKVDRVLETLSQRLNRRRQVLEAEYVCFPEDSDDNCVSAEILQVQKNQLIDVQERLERYCKPLLVLGFNSAKYDINLIKSSLFLLPKLINSRDIEPVVIRKTNQYISFKFGVIKLLDIMNILGGATSLDSFLKAYKTSETKRFFP